MTADPITEAVRADLLRRSQVGIAKYGVTLARTDLDLRAWLEHAYQECLDQAQYLKRAIVEIDKMRAAKSKPKRRRNPNSMIHIAPPGEGRAGERKALAIATGLRV